MGRDLSRINTEEIIMNARSVLIGLLGVGTLAAFGADANAAVCALRSSSGSCLMWSGSVSTRLEADNLSGGPNHTYAFDSVVTNGGASATALNVYGAALCTNQGGNQSPGIQTVLITDPTFLTRQDPNNLNLFPGDAFFSQSNVTGLPNNSGKIATTADKQPTSFFYVRPDTTVCQGDSCLQEAFNSATGKQYCPNLNWTITDVVPCVGKMAVRFIKDGVFSESNTVSCALNRCEDLAKNPNNFGHFVVQASNVCQ
jgi:hypothetical protein